MEHFISDLQQIDKTQAALFGGKGANLGELSGIEDILVPPGFCISIEAFKKIIETTASFKTLTDRLSLLKPEDRARISELSAEIRSTIEASTIPEDLAEAIGQHLKKQGEHLAYAVRSSATTEDLPTASFAGQQETYLNIIGKETILKHIKKCWASLFTDRAVIYRMQNGFDHHLVHLSVIVQQMVFPQVSGILFTADPVSSNRKVLSVDASFGLGEALVSGLVNADVYKVRDGKIIDKKISAKKLAIYALKEGGTKEQVIVPEQQNLQALSDGQILQLEKTGRKIESHFGQPQDIEWCLADGAFYMLQSRPITTLFPIPEANDDKDHIYISVGHQQMMTGAMKPLGLSLWQLTAARPMFKAGGRLFVDVAQELSSADKRQKILDLMGRSEPLIKDALMTLVERTDLEQNTDHKED